MCSCRGRRSGDVGDQRGTSGRGRGCFRVVMNLDALPWSDDRGSLGVTNRDGPEKRSAWTDESTFDEEPLRLLPAPAGSSSSSIETMWWASMKTICPRPPASGRRSGSRGRRRGRFLRRLSSPDLDLELAFVGGSDDRHGTATPRRAGTNLDRGSGRASRRGSELRWFGRHVVGLLRQVRDDLGVVARAFAGLRRRGGDAAGEGVDEAVGGVLGDRAEGGRLRFAQPCQSSFVAVRSPSPPKP